MSGNSVFFFLSQQVLGIVFFLLFLANGKKCMKCVESAPHSHTFHEFHCSKIVARKIVSAAVVFNSHYELINKWKNQQRN